MSQGKGPRLSAQPFVDWLNKRLELLERDNPPQDDNGLPMTGRGPLTPLQALARELDTSERTIFRYLNSRGYLGSKNRDRKVDTFAVTAVEKLLDNAGFRLGDVYPEYDFDNVELEPDARCTHCGDVVSPINGRCPWCSRPVSIISVEQAERARKLVDSGYSITAAVRELLPELSVNTADYAARILREEFVYHGWDQGLGLNARRKRKAA